MRKIRLICILLLWFFPLPLWAWSYQELKPGLEYATLSISPTPTKLHLLKIDLKKFTVKPILAKDTALPVQSMAEKSGALAVLNANFFDKQNQPLGLVLLEGKIKNPFHPTKWWASLLIKGERAKIAKVFRASQVRGYTMGIQAGPRLVINGKVPKLKEGNSQKSAVGIDSKGKLILVVSEGSIGINQLAKILAKPQSKGGVGLKNALNLDGGSSTQFFMKVDGREVNIPGWVKVPVGLGVFHQ